MQVIMAMEINTVYMFNDILHVDWLYEDHQRSKGYKIITSKVGLSSTCPAH